MCDYPPLWAREAEFLAIVLLKRPADRFCRLIEDIREETVQFEIGCHSSAFKAVLCNHVVTVANACQVLAALATSG